MTEPAEPIAVLSDLHLDPGRRWRDALERLRPAWRGARTVVFNGDTLNLEFWRSEPALREALAYIHALCGADGARAILVPGTTDWALEGPRHLLLRAGRVLLMHGDAVFESISPWRSGRRELLRLRRSARDALPAARRGTLAGELACVREALAAAEVRMPRLSGSCAAGKLRWLWDVLTHPSVPVHVAAAWWRMPFAAARFARRFAPGAGIVLLGHVHRAGVWRVGGRTIINTGCFERPLPAFVLRLSGQRLTVHRLSGDPRGFAAGPAAWTFDV